MNSFKSLFVQSSFCFKSSFRLLALVGISGVLVTGCSVERNYDSGAYEATDYEIQGFFENYGDVNIQTRGGYMAGDIGIVSVNEKAIINGYNDTEQTSLDVLVSNEKGAAMTQFYIMGGINHAALVPGAEFSFTEGGYDVSGGETDLAIEGIACSGNGDLYDWSYDEPLESIDVVVEEGAAPDSRRLNFTTVQNGQEAEGYLDVLVTE